MSETPNLCREIMNQACADCPMRVIPQEAWQYDMDEETAYYAGETFKDAVDHYASYQAPETETEENPQCFVDEELGVVMNNIHEGVLPLYTADDESVYTSFDVSEKVPGELVIADRDLDLLTRTPEIDFNDTAKGVLSCLRRNREAQCFGTGSSEDVLLPLGLIDLKSGMNHVETVARHGSDQEVESLLSRLNEAILSMDEGWARLLAQHDDVTDVLGSNNPAVRRSALRVYTDVLQAGITNKE